jgi:hypothetical protein
MARKDYTDDSVRRALEHHINTDAIRSVKCSQTTGGKWIVELPAFGTLRPLTLSEASALCYGLAASERHWRPRRSEFSVGDHVNVVGNDTFKDESILWTVAGIVNNGASARVFYRNVSAVVPTANLRPV